MDNIVIVEYDRQWVELFEQEAIYLRNLLGKASILRIEHFGSTAIPGMPAKPIIDMLVEIPSFDRIQQEALPKLVDAGYEYRWRSDRPPGHMMFVKRSPDGKRTHHVHMATAGHTLWERLYFRNYLCSHPAEAARYAQLKRDLAAQFSGDREAYTNGKSEYVNLITTKAKLDATNS
ncbi:GrpB family protein [Cyanosarcina cf. burmensis CCALA 770]|nr:GrpB family protein [Cyanosarcina cf. burmensis CCALA 770]